MPARTPDTGVKRFEIRTGVNGIPILGGIFRAGDPATIPQHKLHMGVNIRITPGGMITRPGLDDVYNTGVAECITGLTSDGEDLSTVLLYPGAPQGQVDVAIDPLYGGGTAAVYLNSMSFRAIFPRGGDVAYSEYAAVLYGQAGALGALSPVAEPCSVDGGTFAPYGTSYFEPFLFNGRICQFMVMPKLSAATGTYSPAVALVVLDLPTRTKELASDCQRWTGYAQESTYPLDVAGSCPGDYPDPPDTVWPGSYPVGSANVVFYVDNPFTSPEVISTIYEALPFARRSDSVIDDTVGVREMLYFTVAGDAGTFALVRWDGVVQVTITTQAALSFTPLKPILGGGLYGPFVMASTDGVHGNWGGYINAADAWTPFTQGIRYDYGILGAPPAPGVVAVEIESWAAVKQSISGNPEILLQGEMKKLYGGAWIDAGGMWVFEWTSANEFNKVVATLLTPTNTAGGLPWPYIVVPDQYHPLDTLGTVFCALIAGFTDIHPESIVYAPYDASADYATYHANRTTEDLSAYQAVGFSDWAKWLQNVAGRLYCGGAFYDTDDDYHEVWDATVPGSLELLYKGETLVNLATAETVSKGCLPTVPASEIGEGYGSPEGFEAA